MRSSGTLIRATVAHVTEDEPATAAMTPQPTMLTCSRRPGNQDSHGASPLNMSADSRVRNRISPIQMNSGRAVSAQFQLASHTVVASSEPAGAGENTSRARKPTASSDIATQIPDASNASMKPNRMTVTSAGSIRSVSALGSNQRPAWRCRRAPPGYVFSSA